MVGWAVRVVAAFLTSGFEERIGVDFKGLRALGWPVQGVRAVPQFFALVLPQNLWLMRSAWTFLRTVFYSRTQKDTSVENCCCCQSAFTARPPQASVPPSWGSFLALQNSSYFGRVHLGLPRISAQNIRNPWVFSKMSRNVRHILRPTGNTMIQKRRVKIVWINSQVICRRKDRQDLVFSFHGELDGKARVNGPLCHPCVTMVWCARTA